MTHYIRAVEQSPTLTGPLRALPWADEAICATTDPEIWFPDKGNGSYVTIDGTREHRAKSICRRCPALRACEQRAYQNGLWATQRYHHADAYAAGVQAARDAVAALPGTGTTVPGEGKVLGRADALAAIDALTKEDK